MLKIEKITDKVEEQLDVKGQGDCDIVGSSTSNWSCHHDCSDSTTPYKSHIH